MAANQSGGSTVLVVEDDDACRSLMVELLDRIGCTVAQAASGKEALALAKANRPALVLLDVGIPGITGYEVCHELREMFGHSLPVVLVSGNRVESHDRVAGLLIGADDYIVKPFDPDELVARVRRLLVRNSGSGRHVDRRQETSTSIASLTKREHQVLTLLAHGRNQNQIAAELCISATTVATHVQRLLPKLGVHSRAEAVALAHRERLVEDVEAPIPATSSSRRGRPTPASTTS